MKADRAVQSLPIASIVIGKRVGFYCAAHAAQLGADMAANGQHDPIHVKRNGNAANLPWTLIAGLHRLRGAEHAGLGEVNAIEVAGPSATDADLRRLELSENLDHRQRRPIELAIMVDARAKLEEAIDYPGRVGETSQIRAARTRWDASEADAGVTMTPASWRERTAAAFGCSKETIKRLQRIHRDIVEALPDLAEQLNFHVLGETLSAITELAKVPEIDRRKAADMILSKSDWQNIKDALIAAKVRASNGNRVRDLGARVMNIWSEMSLHQQQAHVEWLADEMTPGMAVGLVARLRANGRML